MRILKIALCALLAALLTFGALAEEETPEAPEESVVEQAEEVKEEKKPDETPREAPVEKTVERSAEASSDSEAATSRGDDEPPSEAKASEEETEKTSEETESEQGEPEETTDDSSVNEPEAVSDEKTDEATGEKDDKDTDGESDETPDAGPVKLILSITQLQGAENVDGVFRLMRGQPASMTFSWNNSEVWESFNVRLADSQGEGSASGQTDTSYTVDLSALSSGHYEFIVEAVAQGAVAASAQYAFELSAGGGPGGGGSGGGGAEEGMEEGGFSGGHGGGSRSGGSGGSGGGSSEAAGDQGFHVTAGQALTDSHTSGTKDMRRYGAVELNVEDAEMSKLTLDGTSLDVMLDDGKGVFTAGVEANKLILTAASGNVWRVSGRALRTLSDSGVKALVLRTGDWTREMTTTPALQGGVYANLRAEGCVSGDFNYQISGEGTLVTAADRTYRLNGTGALEPVEG